MEHSASVVREVAVRIILSVYRQHGAAVVSYLPPKDAAARKNFLYKALFNEFAKIDGKLVATQARISRLLCKEMHLIYINRWLHNWLFSVV